MLEFLFIAAMSIAFLTAYGLVAGFTIQLARRVGYSPEVCVTAGLGWPIGLGLVTTFGLSRNIGTSEAERMKVRHISASEQRVEEMDAQVHATRMAELKAKEALALEKAIHPTYKAVEGGDAPEQRTLRIEADPKRRGY